MRLNFLKNEFETNKQICVQMCFTLEQLDGSKLGWITFCIALQFFIRCNLSTIYVYFQVILNNKFEVKHEHKI